MSNDNILRTVSAISSYTCYLMGPSIVMQQEYYIFIRKLKYLSEYNDLILVVSVGFNILYSSITTLLTLLNASTDAENRQALCLREGERALSCDKGSGDLAPMVVLFVAQLVGGAGGSIFYTLGVAYMDDNIKRSKAPALISELEYVLITF